MLFRSAGVAQQTVFSKGARVGIAARNSANWAIAYMGIILAGGCATLLNGFWSGDELAFGVKLAECDLVLADAGRARRLAGTNHQAQVVLINHDCATKQGPARLRSEKRREGKRVVSPGMYLLAAD